MGKMLTDGQLVRNVLNGDNSSFDILVSRYSKSVRSMLVKRNIPQVDDVLQDAFIKVYLNLAKYDERYSFAGWVMTIAKNISIDNQRRVSLSNDLASPIETVNLPSLYPDPEQLVVRTQLAQNLDSLMNKLSDNYRIILGLRFDEELSYEEIASKLHIPIGTVKTQIHRARHALLSLIEENK